MRFPVSGVECAPWLPPLVAFAVSCVTATGGVSGAFLLLPFQMSVLGFATPAASATNLIYNVVAVPGGAWRYAREGRMTWPLVWAIVAGGLPGVFAGTLIRTRYLADPCYMRLFAGAVLAYVGVRLLWGKSEPQPDGAGERCATLAASASLVEYGFRGKVYRFRPAAVALLALVVGLVGGIYGVGGGAMIAPFLVGMLGLPVHTVAGAALCGTFVTSLAGIAFFEALGTRPDWLLGAFFGAGGLAGTYAGARFQKHLPERWIRLGLAVLTLGLALSYVF